MNQHAYDIYAGVVYTAAAIGTAICTTHFQTKCTMKGAVPGDEVLLKRVRSASRDFEGEIVDMCLKYYNYFFCKCKKRFLRKIYYEYKSKTINIRCYS